MKDRKKKELKERTKYHKWMIRKVGKKREKQKERGKSNGIRNKSRSLHERSFL